MAAVRTLTEITLYSAVLFVALLALRAALGRRMSPALRFGLWLLLLARLVLPVTFESGWHVNLLPLQQQAAFAQTAPASTTGPRLPSAQALTHVSSAALPLASPPAAPAANVLRPQQAPTAAPTVPVDAGQIALEVWLAGTALGLLYLITLYTLLRRRIRRNALRPSARLMWLFEQAKTELGIRAPVRLVCTSGFGTPALLFPRMVIMPLDVLLSMDEQRIRYALRHELIHYRRGDHWFMLTLAVLQAIHWYNPVVWLAFPMIRADMEAACDVAVVRGMDAESRGDYAAMLLSLFARKRYGLALSLSGGTRRAAEQRIRAIFAPCRSRRGVRLVCTALAAVLALGCFTTACQPTPEKPAVAGKDDARLEQLIEATGTGRAAEAPQRHTETFAGADSTVTISIDASITTPEEPLPVVSVRPKVLSAEQSKAMAQVLFRGATAYDTQAGLTKNDLKEQIVSLKALIADEQGLLDSCSGDQVTADKVKAQYEQQVADLDAQVPAAPDTLPIRETDWTFHPMTYYQGEAAARDDPDARAWQYMWLNATVDGYPSLLQAYNLVTNERIYHGMTFMMGSYLGEGNVPMWRNTDAKPMAMTQEQAIAMVKKALSDMGITNMRLSRCRAYGKPSAVSTPQSAQEAIDQAAAVSPVPSTAPADGEVYDYGLTFVPEYEGVPVVETGHSIAATKDRYGLNYEYESLLVGVRYDIITHMDWVAPMETAEIENASAATIPLEQALDIFRQRMRQQYTLGKLMGTDPSWSGYQAELDKLKSGEVDIQEIRLGLQRIRLKDKPGAFRMVPAWVFLGSQKTMNKGSDQWKHFQRPDELVSYAIINAIDGSIIDPEQGY